MGIGAAEVSYKLYVGGRRERFDRRRASMVGTVLLCIK